MTSLALLLCLLIVAPALALILPKYDVPQLPLWPYPSSVSASTSATILTVDASALASFMKLKFSCIGASCSSVLSKAMSRYSGYILWAGKSSPPGTLMQVQVNASSIPTLALGIDESYELSIGASASSVTITAPTEWGAMHALETLSQLILWNATNSAYYITNVPISITDAPRFQWRSVLIDSSRHFLPVSTVKHVLDAMSFNKFNVLHWHLSDDQSFPFYSTSFPSLSGLGAYSPRAVYNVTDIASVIQHAQERGIRVVPEFDTPGHTGSWMPAWPDVGVPCPGTYPLMNPTDPDLYPRLTTLFTEIAKRFPDDYIHLGGDEVQLMCWAADSNITKWMTAHGTSNILDVQAYHEQQMVAIAAAQNKQSIGWEEVFRNQGSVFKLPSSIVVDVWETGIDTLVAAVKAGYKTLWSWDQQIPNPSKTFYLWLDTWMDFYYNDPLVGSGLTPAEQALVLGGGASQWGEQVDSTCIDERMWPRASATAERLWSPSYVNDTNDAQNRLIAFRCHMVRRGVRASPIRPDWCELGPLGVL